MGISNERTCIGAEGARAESLCVERAGLKDLGLKGPPFQLFVLVFHPSSCVKDTPCHSLRSLSASIFVRERHPLPLPVLFVCVHLRARTTPSSLSYLRARGTPRSSSASIFVRERHPSPRSLSRSLVYLRAPNTPLIHPRSPRSSQW